ncbi:MAG: phosphotransferase [Candidatus Accumulibacter sp.]|nr:phosphotransferase [Accumulibacter sp.]
MMTGGAQIIEADAHGTKVLLLPDGSYLKFFRRKRLFSSALWSPYAQRFADNCRALATHRIPCPEVIALYRITSIARDAVHYYPLPGQTLRSLLQQGIDEAEAVRLRRQLGNFVARLHILGIYFRSLHLGNIVRTPQDALGLIDLADIRIHRRGLDRFHRQRNLKHLSRYPEEAQWLSAQGDFSVAYHAGIAPTGKNAIWL